MKNPPTNIAGYDPTKHTAGCKWNAAAAQLAIDFFAEVLSHPDDSPGKRAGDKFVLEPWQRDYVGTLFGWLRPDGTRRYSESLMAVPRKNGKTALAAGLALYGLWAEARSSSQIYSAAMDRDQASAIYRTASRMVKQSKELSEDLDCIDSTKRITFKRTGSFYNALSGDANTGHSKKPYYVLFDELHTQRTRALYDNLRTGFGSTINRLFLSITTAGYDRQSICYDVWNLARNVRDGSNENPYFLPCIYELPEGAPWDDETTWHKCNPNLGVSISLDFLREECQRAKDSPAYENTFRNLYLNQWVEQAVRWISMAKWAKGNDPLPDLRDEPCWAAIDLSTTRDITAIVLAFPRDDGGYHLLCRFFVPRENATKREQRDGVPYMTWERQGHLTLTPGDWIDQGAIRQAMGELAKQYNIREVAVDPWNGAPLMQALMEDGFEVCEHRQGMGSMAGPTKEFDRLIVGEKIQHGNNPILTWMAGNAAVEMDAHENMKPTKKRSTERIDGIVAAVMAVGRASVSNGGDGKSYYESNPLEIG